MNEEFKHILMAKKRAMSMGKYSAYKDEYNQSKLAPSVSNMVFLLDRPSNHKSEDGNYIADLYFISKTANSINRYCDSNIIKGDCATEYWLELFLWYVDSVMLIK